MQHVRQVLERLLQNRLFVKAEKYHFHSDTVYFLGLIVSAGSIQMDPAKVEAVKDWPVPETCKSLQQFLGFANFYQWFIQGYSSIASPLHHLTSSKNKFIWNPEAQAAFSTLKDGFSSTPIMTLPDSCTVNSLSWRRMHWTLAWAGSAEEDNRVQSCAFFSHQLPPTERNYDVGDRELLAVVRLALEEWRHWLEGQSMLSLFGLIIKT